MDPAVGEFLLWERDGREFGWVMPTAPLWKRMPIIRHVRAIVGGIKVEFWYACGPGAFGVRSGYDNWVLVGIWHGRERSRP